MGNATVSDSILSTTNEDVSGTSDVISFPNVTQGNMISCTVVPVLLLPYTRLTN